MHALAYRATAGRAQNAKYPTMLLTVTGRKSGKPRTVPVIYIKDGDRFVIAAAYSGSDTDPAWWLNLRANPRAEVQVMGSTMQVEATEASQVEATEASSDDRPELWRRLVQMYPYFADYERRTTRQIPVIVLNPVGP
ncbi:nitroreductase/quinone reductase family protein [Mycobacterium sp. 29Ha]|uniref:nitroreductase/quinone reductase family protein n=1 Tax=Mycobacterium sp. 29Ha TaxID=2939268 RepID=UPI00293915EF|nr:nitroreductase/quinone reductase family protein [Mycobacterium sp. 29Ha]MDV3135977.1 nitroreductase family deazaflavin-dependent oxidoreductase [Mycobacterium sp. 29Ha]